MLRFNNKLIRLNDNLAGVKDSVETYIEYTSITNIVNLIYTVNI